jgi:hypothetical protein
MALKNEECRPLIARLLGTAPESLLGWLVIGLGVNKQAFMVSNGNPQQVGVLLQLGAKAIETAPEEMTNRE